MVSIAVKRMEDAMATARRKQERSGDDSLHDADFHAWTQQQAALIRERRIGELDLDNILEEIESLGRTERSELVDRLELLIRHLLKWQVQPDRRSRNWLATIVEQRRRIPRHLRQNPSLTSFLAEALELAFGDAIAIAVAETGLDRALFPATLPYTFEQLMDPDFLPGPTRDA